MHRTVGILPIALVAGIAVAMLGHQFLTAQQAPVTHTILQQKKERSNSDKLASSILLAASKPHN